MKILIAADSFKDALSAENVCAAIGAGIQAVHPAWEVISFPLADGGEGTLDVLLRRLGGKREQVQVKDPLFRAIEASFGILDNGNLLMAELAQSSGLPLLTSKERDPLRTTTFGFGELIQTGISQSNPKQIVLGLGGSATNDGGMGMAAALGYRFYDQKGALLEPIGANLGKVHRMDGSEVQFRPGDFPVTVICDVDNPLLGEKGATRTYGPQKGASPEVVEQLEAGMKQYIHVVESFFGKRFRDIPGAGAAGGMGAACLAFLNAELRPGVDLVMELCGFDTVIKGADWIFTGEGRIDGQTLHGKLIHGICTKAEKLQVPVIALCGALQADTEMLKAVGLRSAFSIAKGPGSLETALATTAENLEQTAARVALLLPGTCQVPKI